MPRFVPDAGGLNAPTTRYDRSINRKTVWPCMDRQDASVNHRLENRIAMNPLFRRALSFWSCAYLSTAISAGVFVWVVGHRGIYLYDQSGVFDGAWRMVQGQVMYRDFYAPYGPMVFWIQSLFFRLAGVDYSSMVLSAAVVNGVAVLCVIWLVRRLFPGSLHRPTAIAAGMVTAVWFQAPSGTLWFEQTSFCFNLFALILLIETGFRTARTAVYLRLVAGCSLALAVLSKQSAGLVLLPVPVGAAVIISFPDWRKTFTALLQLSAGILLVAVMFFIWLWGFSSLPGFWQSVVVTSRVLAGTRIARANSLTSLLLLEQTLPYVRVALAAFVVFALSRGAFTTPHRLLVSWILLSYIFLQNIFASITLNDVANSVGYLGLINGLAFGLFSRVFWKKRRESDRPLKYWAMAAVPVLIAVLLFYRPTLRGWRTSAWRTVQQFDRNATFDERLQVAGASRVMWGEPTIMDDLTVTRQDFENVNAYLSESNATFYVFPYSTLLYGLHKKPSPQPYVYFMPDHSFLMSDIAQVGTKIVESLQKNNVTVIVLEQSSSFHNEDLLRQMPDLSTWLRSRFQKTREFGYYQVWTLRN